MKIRSKLFPVLFATFCCLPLLFSQPLNSSLPSSNLMVINSTEQHNLNDVHCPICWESLLQIFPSFFNCTHNLFHASCVFEVVSNHKILPRLTSCPVCRANIKPREINIREKSVKSLRLLHELQTRNESILMNLNYSRISPLEHFRNLVLLSRHEYYDFAMNMHRRFLTDNQTFEYTRLLLDGDSESYNHISSYIQIMRVEDWSIISPLFIIALARNYPFNVLRDLIRMGPLHALHIEYEYLLLILNLLKCAYCCDI